MIVEDKSSPPTLANLGGDDKRADAHEGHAGRLPAQCQSVFERKPAPDVIRGGYRFA
jgi:hypothetical protein